jgi:biopolymer transport protein ExbD
MAATAARGRRGGIVGINVTPMVDVVLVLLVIMMVSATYIVSQSLKVELPKTASSDEVASSASAVTVTKDGRYLYGDEEVDEASLRARLEAAHSAKADVNLVITADGDAAHKNVVHVMDVARDVGISKFAVRVEKTL